MNGSFRRDLTEDCNFLVAAEVGSQKYIRAAPVIPTVLPSWVTDAWTHRHEDTFDATDCQFWTAHKLPVFSGLTITVSGFSMKERTELKALIQGNGQKYIVSQKWRSWKVVPVNASWVQDSVSKGYCLPEESYIVEDHSPSRPNSTVKRSTPKELFMPPLPIVNPDCSMIQGKTSANETYISEVSSAFRNEVEETLATANDHSRITNVKPLTLLPAVSSDDTAQLDVTVNPEDDGAKCSETTLMAEFGDDVWNDLLSCKSVQSRCLDGCCLFFFGFTNDAVKILTKLVQSAMGQVAAQITDDVTHIVCGRTAHYHDIKAMVGDRRTNQAIVVNCGWLLGSCKGGVRLPEISFLLDTASTVLTDAGDTSSKTISTMKDSSLLQMEDDLQAVYCQYIIDDEVGKRENMTQDANISAMADGTRHENKDLNSTVHSRELFKGSTFRLIDFSEKRKAELGVIITDLGGT
ncbi:unnamed protein product [Soboliphyme baturini]|uniref:BRCT domain-containing protein n=1 Tax=Soboliphyme baturini TaxID=241478 RepID=A0A183I936_9BILA|nr:unnamed protein product [Soboliphyme baturini]